MSKFRSNDFFNLSSSSDDENNKTNISKKHLTTTKKASKDKRALKQSDIINREVPTLKKKRSVSSQKHKASQSMMIDGMYPERKSQKNKRIDPRSTVRMQDLTAMYPSATYQRQLLQDEHFLKVKVNSLQNSIKSQEKTLKRIQRKITDEKADLYMIKDKFDQKAKRENIREERSILVSSLLSQCAEEENKKRLSLSFSKSGKNKPKQKENDPELKNEYIDLINKNKRKSLDSYIPKNCSQQSIEEKKNSFSEAMFRSTGTIKLQSDKKDKRKRSEQEIEKLKTEIQFIQEENFKMKCHIISLKDYENTESLYSQKLKELEEAVTQKEREIAEREGYYKGQIEDIMIKMEELQNEVGKMADYRGKVEQMTEQLHLKDRELQMIKQYYLDKPQAKIFEASHKQNRHSKTYSELVSEIRQLKAEMDMLDNDKFSSSKISSSFISKDDSEIISSKIMSQD